MIIILRLQYAPRGLPEKHLSEAKKAYYFTLHTEKVLYKWVFCGAY